MEPASPPKICWGDLPKVKQLLRKKLDIKLGLRARSRVLFSTVWETTKWGMDQMMIVAVEEARSLTERTHLHCTYRYENV